LSKQIAAGNSTLNLQGVMVGDGAIDPATQFVGYSQLAFYMGFANLHELRHVFFWFFLVLFVQTVKKRRDVMAGYEAVISSYIQQVFVQHVMTFVFFFIFLIAKLEARI
jgi:hypothetical protein